jgi:hypothetical protein
MTEFQTDCSEKKLDRRANDLLLMIYRSVHLRSTGVSGVQLICAEKAQEGADEMEP